MNTCGDVHWSVRNHSGMRVASRFAARDQANLDVTALTSMNSYAAVVKMS